MEIPEIIKSQIKSTLYFKGGDIEYMEKQLRTIREELLNRIGSYKRLKRDMSEQQGRIETLRQWVEENNINLDIEENGK